VFFRTWYYKYTKYPKKHEAQQHQVLKTTSEWDQKYLLDTTKIGQLDWARNRRSEADPSQSFEQNSSIKKRNLRIEFWRTLDCRSEDQIGTLERLIQEVQN